MAKIIRPKDALDYHEQGRPGKIEVISSKPTNNQRDLALAYSPGVAEPCKAIANNPEDVYRYTAKGNLVAVITNGTAVLGLGDIGPEASKPVMEGKAVLFKVFADIDVYDIELNSRDIDHFVSVVKALEPTFGGINLEDIAAPECFEIEERLKKELRIPIMHDDQHGTAIITAAGLLNALEVTGKDIKKIRVVVNGAGASAVSCTRLIISLGVHPQNVLMLDSKGIIHDKRKDLNGLKGLFAANTDKRSLEEALDGADFFLGLSRGNILKPALLERMAPNPIVFALANPDPEISYDLATKTRKDVIVATGRSDHPNQVNNVLGFPFIFRGALDVRATAINEAMKLAAVRALADLAKKPVPDIVKLAYNMPALCFGPEYIIPKPLDPRLISTVAPAVAKAAVDSGVAKNPILDWERYEISLQQRMGHENQLMRVVFNRARKNVKRIVFPDGDSLQVLMAAQTLSDEGLAKPVLLGNIKKMKRLIKENGLDLEGLEMIDPMDQETMRHKYGKVLFDKRNRKGYTLEEARRTMKTRNYFAMAMVEAGDVDAVVAGHSRKYADVLRAGFHLVGTEPGCNNVSGMYIMLTKRGIMFFADTTVNVNPDVETIVHTGEILARAIRHFDMVPRMALLSYSNFGSTPTGSSEKMAKAAELLRKRNPDLVVDGEMQANFALNSELLQTHFPFSTLVDQKVNALLFPSLSAGNIAYKLLQELGGIEAIGPILLGMAKSVHIVQRGCSVREIVNVAAVAAMDAQIIQSKNQMS
ncbi:MAG: NADP-dependent malic enzyme [Bacteroidetes bacterium]|nr:NADP-dependent malic enzyme [Bacteroidota bacterium]